MRCTGFLTLLAGLRRSRCGAAAVEFGLVIPILLVLVLGTVEIGRMLYQNHIVTKSVRDGARFLARMPITGSDCSDYAFATTITGDQPDVVALDGDADKLIKTGKTGTVTSTDYLVPGWGKSGAAIVVDVQSECVINSGQFRGSSDIPVVRVTATVPYTSVFGGLWGADLTTFTVTHKERYIGE